MASIVIWLIGLLFLGLGIWILALRVEGLLDWFGPRGMSIGTMTVDGQESRGHAELFRSRFDHHFRRPVAIPKETGFLEVLSLDTPKLFEQEGLDSPLGKMTLDVSGVDLAKLVQFVNQLAKPAEWIVEGDFQTQSNRALLALRLRRGDRLIRTWYLERSGNTSSDKSIVLQKLIDDAIFQLVYDFENKAEQDSDLLKWRGIISSQSSSPSFPSREALAAYYEAQGALGRYYANREWSDLDVAVERLQTLRAQMPEYADGLRLLATALSEKRNETEAIHVYEQLRSILLPGEADWDQLPAEQKSRVLSVDLLKATATTKLYTWQSAHEAVRELLAVNEGLRKESAVAGLSEKERAAYTELRAQTAVQLAYTYALYLQYIRQYAVRDMFGSKDTDVPKELRVSDPAELEALLPGGDRDMAKKIVRREMKTVASEHAKWLASAKQEQAALETLWKELGDPERRKAELTSRMHLAAGLAHYRMVELENHESPKADTIFGDTFDARMERAGAELRAAEAAHPNHYTVLQLLGLVYSEPRLDGASLSIAEQYFERAIRANPSDYYGHELLSGLLFRRAASIGADLGALETIKRGLSEADKAIQQREISGPSQLLRAQFQTMLIEIERDAAKRRELRLVLDQYIEQAERFLPRPLRRIDVDLTWVRIAAATRRLGEEAEAPRTAQNNAESSRQSKARRFQQSRGELLKLVEQLIEDCQLLEDRWVAEQRLFQVKNLHKRAQEIQEAIERATLENWREIQIPFQ